MTKVHIGFLTNNAGDDIPGSTLKATIKRCIEKFDSIIVVDGNLTESSKIYYERSGVNYLNSPWTGKHVDQYMARDKCANPGDWMLALDCDEAPSDDLINFIQTLRTGRHSTGQIQQIILPVVTWWCKNNSNIYYRVEPWPDEKGNAAGHKRILYKIDPDNLFFHTSRTGTHVTPIVRKGASAVISYPYLHFKSPETMAMNASVTIMEDIRPIDWVPGSRGFYEEDVVELEQIAKKYGLDSGPEFRKATRRHTWPEELKAFFKKFKRSKGTVGICPYLAYYCIEKAEVDMDDPHLCTYEYACSSIGTPSYEEIYRKTSVSADPRDTMIIDHTDVLFKDPEMPMGAG